jgi:AI-2 transport protein TqsA
MAAPPPAREATEPGAPRPRAPRRPGNPLLALAALVIVVAGLRAAGPVLVPLLLAMFLAVVSLPVVTWLRARRVPTAAAVAAALLLDVVVVAGIVALVAGSVAQFRDQLPLYQRRLAGVAADALHQLDRLGIDTSPWVTEGRLNPALLLGLVQGLLGGIAGVLQETVVILLTVVLLLFEAVGLPAKLVAAFRGPSHARRFARVVTEVQRFLAIKTVLSLATGAVTAAALLLIGVDLALLWGFLAFVLHFIPNVGALLAAVPPVLLALAQLGPGVAALVALVYVAVGTVIGNLVEPYLTGRRLGLSTLVVFLSLVFWGWLWGAVGMLLSVPLTMVVKIACEESERFRWVAVLLAEAPDERRAAPPTASG